MIQYAVGDGPVILHETFREPIITTLRLIEKFVKNSDGICGFNLTFDMFQLCKCYTTLKLLAEKVGEFEFPEDHIDLMGSLESEARDGPCLKPVKACDLMLVARKGPYQSMMNRGDIRIRRVPTPLAHRLVAELDKKIKIKDIYFAKRKDKTEKWKVFDIEDEDGDIVPDFKDVVLTFAPSSALKVLVIDALGIDPSDVLLFNSIAVDQCWLPEEFGFAPFATAVGTSGDWNKAWPEVVRYHISHWGSSELARKYAAKDVEYLPRLYEFFGSPELGDDDSELACMVASVRWRGFKIDIPGIEALRAEAIDKAKSTVTSPNQVKIYIEQVLHPSEKKVLKGSTKKIILEELRDDPLWAAIPCDCETEPCVICGGEKVFRHPASLRAEEVLNARMANKEVELYDKLLRAGRFHASFVIIGTLSSRMAGTDKLNAQGIKKTKAVRSCFPLAFDGYQLCGGDFKSFEVVLADAVYGDPDLRRDLQTKNTCTGCKGLKVGKKGETCGDCEGTGICDQSIHAIFGTFVYPGYDYVGILNTKGTADDKYTRSKSAVFAMLYGGEEYTLMTRLGVPIEVANDAYRRFSTKYRKVGEERRKVFDMFCSMSQVGGLGSRVEWKDPSDYIESVFGFKRYFTLENMICKALYEIANNPPKDWKELKLKVTRRDREQSASGAVQSALYGAIFGMQSSNMRAAANHVIQSAGAQITKHLQRRIWDLQPSGINEFYVLPVNFHDQVLLPALPEIVPKVRETMETVLEEFRPKVPLIAIDWGDNLQSWAS